MRIAGINPTYNKGALLNKGVNFGRKVNGVEFPDDVVREAEYLLNNNMQIDPAKYQKEFGDCMADVKIQPVTWTLATIMAILGRKEFDKTLVNDSRIALGICTLGISEIPKMFEGGIRFGISKMNAKKYAEQLKDCSIELLKERKLKL